MRLTVTPAFEKAVRKLAPDRVKKTAATLKKFLIEPRLPSLDFRLLKGTENYFIIDSTGGDRIILRKLTDDHYEAVDCGTHDIYRRWDRHEVAMVRAASDVGPHSANDRKASKTRR